MNHGMDTLTVLENFMRETRYTLARAVYACVAAIVIALSAAAVPARAAPLLDSTPRMAVVSAFGPELTLLYGQLHHATRYTCDGVDFPTGRFHGKPGLLF